MILVVVGRVADAVDMVLLVLMRGGVVTDVVGTANGGANTLYFMLITERNTGFPYLY